MAKINKLKKTDYDPVYGCLVTTPLILCFLNSIYLVYYLF